MMRDVVLACCRDEPDIVDVFVRFYLAMGFDEVYVVDNASERETTAVLDDLVAEGLPLRVQRDNRIGYERHLTEYYRWAGRTAEPRWLFFLDVDEFVLFPNGAKAFLDELDPRVNCLTLRQREMFPVGENGGGRGHFLLSTRAEPGFNDTTKDFTRFTPDAHVYGGKHRIELPARCALQPHEIHIRHFKYRTLDQAARKEANCVESHAAYSNRDLERLSAFGVPASREWIERRRAAALAEEWRAHFATDLAHEIDSELANWAAKHLLPELSASR